ncbi:hypothetical protein [Paenibacillus roseipurpureus]|uniref:Copper amine oxidase-like N-terminal domain-containing protein n=1 Tax=Paenibacillus roseopurpureus TaxID=2918901 RepID=A0AA96LP73_9BACL|nr:hypothetical protein [Paenibacillus sp. MBLB1832]WNR44678.1 hypothetical protein MJB10_00485 [Paenibacillus sp. MBLB1832]
MKTNLTLTALLLTFILTTTLSTSQAEAPSPGGSDPVITLSYFEQNTLSEAKVKEIVASAIAANAGGSNGGTGTSPAAVASMKVVQLQNGQTLYAGAGAEFIVRTGRVLAVSNDENGIPDVTGGKDLAAGTEVALNHLLIFPVEGRGIKPSPKNDTTIYVMVRGGYLLLNADGSTVSQ